jgi:hypothetical protein
MWTHLPLYHSWTPTCKKRNEIDLIYQIPFPDGLRRVHRPPARYSLLHKCSTARDHSQLFEESRQVKKVGGHDHICKA